MANLNRYGKIGILDDPSDRFKCKKFHDNTNNWIEILVKQIARDFKCRFDSTNVIQAKN